MAKVFLTTGTSWTVPNNWNNTNTIEIIGAGASGGYLASGGGGGGYSKISNLTLTPSSNVQYQIGQGGSPVSSYLSTGNSGTDTWFNGTAAGSASLWVYGAVGSTGAGGIGGGSGSTTHTGGAGNSGGGGAAGLNGNGNAGNSTTGVGGSGDAGSGGSGGSPSNPGSIGTEYDASHGSGGGGGGYPNVGTNAGGAGGNYGGGGGGNNTGGTSSGAGANALIIITYTPSPLTMTCALGTFTLTGENASFHTTYYLSLNYGTYTLTGISMSFKFNGAYKFGMQTGLFTLTGLNCNLVIGKSDKVLAGIFSLIVSPSLLGETGSGLVMEAQNSYGLVPAADALANGILIDNGQSSNGQDSYYSAWSNGVTSGGINYNDTTLWQNWEPTIETDIIPIGTILSKGTLGNIEFKLDRPMVSGDAIRMWWRPSLSDNYTLMGTTTTAQLSDYYPTRISQSQWAQFMIQFKCASTGSSFICLREVRIHLT